MTASDQVAPLPADALGVRLELQAVPLCPEIRLHLVDAETDLWPCRSGRGPRPYAGRSCAGCVRGRSPTWTRR
ncbi:MAG: hypothetical protein ACODAU_00180 [Myxococcota bacterium]